ncbi:FAD dependent oxidoreductase [Lichtheimia hyalospora FSU 10163]|nr:FAD dependent oxidoreductase [Lichtheimia hyalospora FSU 10163]
MHLNPTSTLSYWLTNAPFQQPTNEPLPDKADIVIIGAGLSGMSTAYWLQQLRPELKVVVVDARGVSSGATGRNGGIITPGLNDDFDAIVNSYGVDAAQNLVEFDYRNVDALAEFLKHHSDNDKGFFDPEITWTKGTIIAWSTAQEAEDSYPGAVALANKIQDIRVLSPEELQKIPGLESFKHGGIHIRTTAIAWAAKIVFCLARYLQNKIHIATHTRVLSVEGNKVITSRGTIQAGRVAYCTNAWSGRLLEKMSPYIVPVRNQVVSARAVEGRPRLEHVLSANRGYQYMSFRPNGDIIMGGMRDIVPSKQEYEDDDSTMNLTVSQGLRKFMREIVHVPSVDKEWVGVMGFSRDRLPIVGNLKPVLGDKEGCHQYISAGFTGHGMPRTFLCGRALAQMLADKPLDDWFPPEFLVEHKSRKSWWNDKSKM